MKIIIFGASGDVGSRLVEESLRRGHEVTAVIRREQGASAFDPSINVLIRDVTTATDLEAVLAGHDVVLSAIRPDNGLESLMVSLTATVVEAARTAGARFLVVGGAAPLLVPDAPGHTVLTAPGFLPPSVVPVATASQEQFDWCMQRLAPDSTYVCPPAMLIPGTRTGSYRLGTDTLVVDGNGQSHISMEDFAIAMLDEVEQPQHAGRPFTVGY